MKKIMNKIKQNAKVVAAFLLGMVLTGGTVYAATVLPSSQVGYDNTQSGLTATDVQGALDELNIKADTWINPLEDYKMTPNKKIIASSSGIKFVRNGHVYAIKANNFNVEKDHIQQIFSDADCMVSSSRVVCDAPDFRVIAYSDGSIMIYDYSDDNQSCNVMPNNAVSFSCSTIQEIKGKNNTVYFDTKTPTTSSTTDYTTLGKNVFLAKNGYQISVCMIRNGRLHCFDHNNLLIEREHIQHVFSDVNCDLIPNQAQSYNARCIASDFKITLGSSDVTLIDNTSRMTCQTSTTNYDMTGRCWDW